MTTREHGKILTANALRDGAVVFFTRAGGWTSDVNDAVLALEDQAAAALEGHGRSAEAANTVTGAYLVDAIRTGPSTLPVHIRERIRAAGPTVRPDLAIGTFQPEKAA